MTYFGVLLTFLVPPLLGLLIIVPRDIWAKVANRGRRIDWEPYLFILAHLIMALVYTTPWDNYLVATSVWWYDTDRVSGITVGYVPIEEYTFFVLQTLLTGLWVLWLKRTFFRTEPTIIERPHLRRLASAVVGMMWMTATLALVLGWQPGRYAALILSWALIPTLIQVAFGADILLGNRNLLLLAVLPPTVYLWLVDAWAITSGVWVIDPVQTTGIKVGPLPLEEMIFFFMTNLIIGLGMTLMLSSVSKARAQMLLRRFTTYHPAPEGQDAAQ